MHQTISVPNVDVGALREQRNELIDLMNEHNVPSGTQLDGLINLLDAMLDIAEIEEI